MTADLVELVLLLRLVQKGHAGASTSNRAIVERLRNAGWITASAKRDQWTAAPAATDQLRDRLYRLRPTLDADLAFLASLGLDVLDIVSWQALPNLTRDKAAFTLLHRKNWNAASSSAAKRSPRTSTSEALTDDWVLRLRSTARFVLLASGSSIDIARETSERSECCVPERLWLALKGLEISQEAVAVTCENLGAFVDLPLPPDTVCIYSPGHDTRPAAAVLCALESLRWCHFGDLDHDGIAIAQQLARRSGRAPRLYVPGFAAELLNSANPARRPWRVDVDLPAVVRDLADRGTTLEQEVFMTDPRLVSDLAEYVDRVRLEPSAG